jgi:hypothetical protein
VIWLVCVSSRTCPAQPSARGAVRPGRARP